MLMQQGFSPLYLLNYLTIPFDTIGFTNFEISTNITSVVDRHT